MCCRHRLQHALDDVYVLAQVLGQTGRGVTAFVAVCIRYCHGHPHPHAAPVTVHTEYVLGEDRVLHVNARSTDDPAEVATSVCQWMGPRARSCADFVAKDLRRQMEYVMSVDSGPLARVRIAACGCLVVVSRVLTACPHATASGVLHAVQPLVSPSPPSLCVPCGRLGRARWHGLCAVPTASVGWYPA